MNEKNGVSRRVRAPLTVRRLIFGAHLLLGLTLGLYLAVIGLTGSVLVWGDAVDEKLNPHLLHVAPRAQAAPLSQSVAAVRKRFAGETLRMVKLPADATKPLVFSLGEWGPSLRQVAVDPYDARVLGERRRGDSLVGFAYYLHTDLLLGDLGNKINGYAVLGTLVLLMSGAWLWLPRRGKRREQLPARLTIKRQAPRLRRLFDWHNVTGIYSLPVLGVAVLTGAVFFWWMPVQNTVYRLTRTPADPPPFKVKPVTSVAAAIVDRLPAAATRAIPDARVDTIGFPGKPDAPFRIGSMLPENVWWGRYATVWIDPNDARVLGRVDPRVARDGGPPDPGHRIMRLIFPLHIGTWGGGFSKWLYVVAGLAPLGLFLTGSAKWLARYRTRVRHRKQRAAGQAPHAPQHAPHAVLEEQNA